MNKHQYKQRAEELEFALEEKTKEFDYQKGEFGRLKKAYKMSERQIRELQQHVKKLNIDDVSQRSELLYEQVNWLMVETPLAVEKITDFRERFEK